MALKEGESVLIEQVANGFIVNPKEISNFTKIEEDVHIFSDFGSLSEWLAEHFRTPTKIKERK